MDASSLIASFLTGSYTVTRRAKAIYTQGVAQPGATSTLTIRASVQPASGGDLVRLPEGRQFLETRVLFTTTRLKVSAEGHPYESDLVNITDPDTGPRVWEVQHIETWVQGGGSYFRCIIQKASL